MRSISAGLTPATLLVFAICAIPVASMGRSEFVTPDFPRWQTGKVCEVRRGADWRPIKGLDGVTQTFAEGWVGDRKLMGGVVYSAANLPAHVSGAGAIRIAGTGFMFLVR